MLSIYDIVFEKVNVRHAFDNVIKLLEYEIIDYDPISAYANPDVEGSSLALRVAIRMIYLSKGYIIEAYGDLLEGAQEQAEDGFIPFAKDILSSGKEDDVIMTLAYLVNELHPETYSYLSSLNMQQWNDYVFHDSEEFTLAVKALMESLSYFESSYGEIPFKECEFSGAYNDIVTSSYAGMPLFLIGDTLWFIDSSTKGPKWQVATLLVAYIMSVHSDIENANRIQWLASYNPITSCAQKLSVYVISNITLRNVCKKVIGYIMPNDKTDPHYNNWRFSSGTDPGRYESAYQFHHINIEKE